MEASALTERRSRLNGTDFVGAPASELLDRTRDSNMERFPDSGEAFPPKVVAPGRDSDSGCDVGAERNDASDWCAADAERDDLSDGDDVSTADCVETSRGDDDASDARRVERAGDGADPECSGTSCEDGNDSLELERDGTECVETSRERDGDASNAERDDTSDGDEAPDAECVGTSGEAGDDASNAERDDPSDDDGASDAECVGTSGECDGDASSAERADTPDDIDASDAERADASRDDRADISEVEGAAGRDRPAVAPLRTGSSRVRFKGGCTRVFACAGVSASKRMTVRFTSPSCGNARSKSSGAGTEGKLSTVRTGGFALAQLPSRSASRIA